MRAMLLLKANCFKVAYYSYPKKKYQKFEICEAK